MAIGAQHPEVVKPMVVVHAVAIVDLNGERASPPFGETAFFASIPQ
jgi:hypothetical protein